MASNPLTITVLVAAIISYLFKIFRSYLSSPRRKYTNYVVEEKSRKTGVFPSVAAAIKVAYPKFEKAAFLITGKRPLISLDMIIIPPKWIDELKNADERQLSFTDAIDERLNFHLIGTAPKEAARNQAVIKSVTVDLTRHISKVMAELNDEIIHACDEILPACDDWTEVFPAEFLPQIVALASGRIFVGLPLCRDEDFIKSTITFTIDSFMAGDKLNDYPKWLRPAIAPWLPQVKRCKEQRATMKRLLKPHLEERRALLEQGEELPADYMSWMINNALPDDKFDLDYQAQAQLGISLAAIHTTTMTTTFALFDLAARREYQQPLIDEWNGVLATEESGIISKSSMPKLRKLDSFLKESQRLSPISPTSFDRKVLQDMRLPDGSMLHKGSYIAAPTEEINLDSSNWKDPQTFDGFRFEKLRQQAGNETRFQFTTTGIESMNFGHGKHACPGRFFAGNEIKLILSYLILNYEIKFADGKQKPASIDTGTGYRPDYATGIMLKRRQA